MQVLFYDNEDDYIEFIEENKDITKIEYKIDDYNYLYIKIKEILGKEFKISPTCNKEEFNKNKLFVFEFINVSGIKNKEKNKYIYEKIKLLEMNNFTEIEDCKISGVGRFIKILIKSIQEYHKDKIELLCEYNDKIKIINEKIEKIKKL